MKNYTVKLYESQDYNDWNAFIGKAKNATFLFHRDFMEYHNDRFEDFSLLIFEDKKLVSVLPANRVENEIFSHQGLTYGGFVFESIIKLPEVLEIVKSLLEFLHKKSIITFQLKLIPSIYNLFYSEEILYAMFLAEAQLIRRDCLSVIDLTKPFSFSRTRRKGIRRGAKHNLVIKEELNFELFWNEILIPNLQKKHQSKPVHTFDEIEKLQKLFPNNIRHFNVYFQDKIVAGTTVFIAKNVLHPQYISGQNDKNELGSLDFLYDYLINDVFKDKQFFDFGPSNEEKGTKINDGILFWKESFDAKTVIQDYYSLKTENFCKLENVLI